jgi:hypothetical protein
VIAYTIEQAAQRVHRSARTIRRWREQDHLKATYEPITGQWYVWEDDLLTAEHAARTRQRQARFADTHRSERMAS